MYISARAICQDLLQALKPLPPHVFFQCQCLPNLLYFLLGRKKILPKSFLPKSFFIRNGQVVGDKTRIARENQRPGIGIAIVDSTSAAVFRDHLHGGLLIAGPGVTTLSSEHTLIATVSLRSGVVVYGGNPWSEKPPPGADDTRVSLSGSQVAARLIGVFALLSPADYPQPQWYAWLQEQMRAQGKQQVLLTYAEAQRYREDFEAQTFRTLFHGHGWAVQSFAEHVLTDVLTQAAEQTDESEEAGVPELFSGARHLFQALLRDAWVDELGEAVKEADKLFEPISDAEDSSSPRWIDEVQRAFRERFTQPVYTPAGQSPKVKRPSREYWQLRAMGLKALTASIIQVYFPPRVEERRAMAVYEPLWAFLEQLQAQAQQYRRVNLSQKMRYALAITYTEYMARRTDELLHKSLRQVLTDMDGEQAQDLARLLLGMTEGTLHWAREDVRLNEHDPRLEHLRLLNRWLRIWARNPGGTR